ncbi:hypothetical protein PEX1_062240 [Penicillium expansum]|nr:hypothetical protein PEX1_062240 [Penicillium expansum]
MSLPEDLQRASVIASYENPLPCNIVSQYGKRIIRISDHQVVKCGPDVTREEFDNQRIAYELVDSRIARIPRDGSLCLVDWASAGFYPRLFEFCIQWIFDGKDGSFNSLLLESVDPLSDYEMAQKEAILCAWRNIQKYPL